MSGRVGVDVVLANRQRVHGHSKRREVIEAVHEELVLPQVEKLVRRKIDADLIGLDDVHGAIAVGAYERHHDSGGNTIRHGDRVARAERSIERALAYDVYVEPFEGRDPRL